MFPYNLPPPYPCPPLTQSAAAESDWRHFTGCQSLKLTPGCILQISDAIQKLLNGDRIAETCPR